MKTHRELRRMRAVLKHLRLPGAKELVRLGGLLAMLPVMACAQNIKENLAPLRLEYVRLNVAGAAATARWYAEHAGLEILPGAPAGLFNVADKDHNFMIEFSAIPGLKTNYVPYVGDHGRNMSLELFGKTDVEMTFAKMTHEVCHLAFTTSEPEKGAKQMICGGARQVGPTRTEPNGDVVVDLFDPSHFPVRLIKRNKPVLKP